VSGEEIADMLHSEEGRPPQRGSIVNCASVNSIQAGAGVTGYTASKHAVMGLTKAVSLPPYTESVATDIQYNLTPPGLSRSSQSRNPYQRSQPWLPANEVT
jgi:NAD(P)-dependent dehydrogenase (short-subunit alcohol dehydrogenase family)